MANHEHITESGHNVPNYKIQNTCNSCREANGCSDIFGDVYHHCNKFNASVHTTGWCPEFVSMNAPPRVDICNGCKALLKGRVTIIYTDGIPFVGYCNTCMKWMDMKEYNKSLEAMRKTFKLVESVRVQI